jgi:hypothetical protein
VLKPAALILEGRGCFLREQFPIAPEGAFANFSLEREARMTVSCFYKWVRARTADGRSESPYRLYHVGINPDGSLINRDNYPEDLVRTSIAAHQAAREAGIRAGVLTRARRREDNVWQAVKR